MAFALAPWLLSGFDSMDCWTGDLSSLWLFARGHPQLFTMWDSSQGSTKRDSRPASEQAEARTREQQHGGTQSLSDASAGSMSHHFLHILFIRSGSPVQPTLTGGLCTKAWVPGDRIIAGAPQGCLPQERFDQF